MHGKHIARPVSSLLSVPVTSQLHGSMFYRTGVIADLWPLYMNLTLIPPRCTVLDMQKWTFCIKASQQFSSDRQTYIQTVRTTLLRGWWMNVEETYDTADNSSFYHATSWVCMSDWLCPLGSVEFFAGLSERLGSQHRNFHTTLEDSTLCNVHAVQCMRGYVLYKCKRNSQPTAQCWSVCTCIVVADAT